MDQQTDPGRVTHPLSLEPPLPGQDVARYQAQDPTHWGDANPPMPWRSLVPPLALFAVACVAMFAPRQVQVIVGMLVAYVAVLQLLRIR